MPSEPKKFQAFVSHKSEDKNLATKLSDKLLILSNGRIEPWLSYDIPGGKQYQNEIESKIRGSDIFIFLYTQERSPLRWCLFETGVFVGSHHLNEKHLICIKNSEIKEAPVTMRNLQTYDSSPEGINKFLIHLLHDGKFTGGERINDELNSKMKTIFEEAIREIVSEFSESTTETKFFRERIEIRFPKSKTSDVPASIEESTIISSEETCKTLGIQNVCPWPALYAAFKEAGNQAWLDDLVETTRLIQEHQEPLHFMSPFMSVRKNQVYIPVLSRVERILNQPQKLFVIFLNTADIPLESGPPDEMFSRMPPAHQAITKLITIALQLRWNVLEPFSHQLETDPDPDLIALRNALQSALEPIEKIGLEFNNISLITDHFPVEDHAAIENTVKRYMRARSRMAQIESNADKSILVGILEDMRWANKLFLMKATNVCLSLIAKLKPFDLTENE